MAVVLLAFQGWAGLASFARLGKAGWAYVLVSVLTLPAYLGSLQLTSIAHAAIIYATVPFAAAAPFLAIAILSLAMMVRDGRDAGEAMATMLLAERAGAEVVRPRA